MKLNDKGPSFNPPATIPFDQVLKALQDADTPLHPRFLFRLSDLDNREISALRGVWEFVPLWRRQRLMEDIGEMSRNDTLLSFLELGRLALEDGDSAVRRLALETLGDYEDTGLASVYLDLLQHDPAAEVRAAAAGNLGAFVYAGELDQISRRLLEKIETHLIEAHNHSPDAPVRRAALESLSYSSRPEVDLMISHAFASEDRAWKASALLAMGRSANTDWEPQVLSMLESTWPQLRGEAARAAGELELHDATPTLLEMLDDPNVQARRIAIWSLSQLGGEGVREALQRLFDEAEDEAEAKYLDSALESLAFTEGAAGLYPMFDLPKDDESEAGVDDFDDDDEEWVEEVDLDEYDLLDDEDDYDDEDEDEYDDEDLTD